MEAQDEKSKIMTYMNVMQFLTKHKDYYSYDTYTLEMLKSYAKRGLAKEVYFTDVIREIYDELGLIPDDKNIFEAFLKLLEQVHGIEGRNIIEVGGGTIPTLGRRIHLKQKTGTITVYDPRIGKDIKGDDRFILKREPFTNKTKLGNADLIIGLMPCKGAEPLLEQAVKHKIDFMLWFCEGGPHGDYFDYFEDDGEWRFSTTHMVERGMEDGKMGQLVKTKLEDYSHYPIIYNQR